MDISSKMQNVIEEQLKEIEEKENVKIIYCVESGSRAWGFASPDSDYDVRFIYVRNKEDYLKLNKNRDVIEWRLDDVLDINGWDIQKALRLLYKSNPTLFEWSMSPIVYKTTPQWEKISGIVSQYFFEKTGAAFLAAPACLLRNRKSQKHFCAFIDVAASERQDEVPRLGMSEDIFPYFLKGFKPDAARNFDSQIGG